MSQKLSKDVSQNELPDGKVEVSKSELGSLLRRLEQLEEQTGGIKRPKRVTEHTVRLCMNGDKVAVSYAKDQYGRTEIWEQKDEKGEVRTKANIVFLDLNTGKEDAETVDYLHFLNNAHRVEALITKQTAKTIESVDRRDGGGGFIRSIDAEKGMQLEDTIALTVERKEYVLDLEIQEGPMQGKTLTVTPECINM